MLAAAEGCATQVVTSNPRSVLVESILRTGHYGLTCVIGSSWSERETVLVEAFEAELVVLRQWTELHRGIFTRDRGQMRMWPYLLSSVSGLLIADVVIIVLLYHASVLLERIAC